MVGLNHHKQLLLLSLPLLLLDLLMDQRALVRYATCANAPQIFWAYRESRELTLQDLLMHDPPAATCSDAAAHRIGKGPIGGWCVCL